MLRQVASFPRLWSHLQNPLINKIVRHQPPFITDLLADPNVASQANPIHRIGIGVGFNKGHPETHRRTKGEDNKTMATYWFSGLTFIRPLLYIKLQRPSPIPFYFCAMAFHSTILDSCSWSGHTKHPVLQPFSPHSLQAFPALPRHIFPSRYLSS